MNIVLIGRVILEKDIVNKTQKVNGNIFNIARFLVQYNKPSSITLIAPLGSDEEAKIIKSEIDKLELNFIPIKINKSPIIEYHSKGPKFFFNDLETQFDLNKINKYEEIIKNAKYGVVDLQNIDITNYVISLNPYTSWVIEPISIYHLNLIPTLKNKNCYIRLNRHKIKELTKLSMFDFSDYYKNKMALQKMGIKRTFITLDRDGVFYFDEKQEGYLRPKVITTKEIEYAGDAFTAGFVNGFKATTDINILAMQGIEKCGNYIKSLINEDNYK